MLNRKKKPLVVPKDAKSLRSKDPFSAFKKKGRAEFGRYDIPGEFWRSFRKLIYVGIVLLLGWFFYECYQAWNIFQ